MASVRQYKTTLILIKKPYPQTHEAYTQIQLSSVTDNMAVVDLWAGSNKVVLNEMGTRGTLYESSV